MKLYFCYENNNVIWPDYLADFIAESMPVKFIEHRGCGFGLGTYPYEPTDDESSDLREWDRKVYMLVDVDEYDDGLLMVDGEVYKERGGELFTVDE